VADVRGYIQATIGAIRGRDDFSDFTDSLIGDCLEPGSQLDTDRYHLSCYARGHYGDLDPDEPGDDSGVIALIEGALAELGAAPSGAWVDVGCSVGRTTFELAARTGELALGVDMSFSMLRCARRIATEGRVVHPLRRVGIVYDRRDFAVDLPARDKVDFWVCDGTGLALADDSADGTTSINLLDCVGSPLGHLIELGRITRPGGPAIIATPFDWSTGATPLEAWLGGHSQRSASRGASEVALRHVLSDHLEPAELRPGLTIEREADASWQVYLHARASMQYRAHVVVARAS
jgi:SAM-dependent methyltransferase